MKICSKHNIHKTKDSQNKLRCKKCNSEAVLKYRRRLKKKAVDYKGGKCSICSYARCLTALEFHHLNSDKKEFGLASKGLTRSWNKVKEELDKCILVCANCHRELHEKTNKI